MRAKYATTCPKCGKKVPIGELIEKIGEKYGHQACAPKRRSSLPSKGSARREFERNKARIEAGETFRGHKPSDWSRGESPSTPRPRR
jgi:hypothetical protein